MRIADTIAIRIAATATIFALTFVLAACGAGTAPPADDSDAGGNEPAENAYWYLYENDGSQPSPLRASGEVAAVNAGQTQIDFTASTPDGWSASVSNPSAFAVGTNSTDVSLSMTMTRPEGSCTVTPATEVGTTHTAFGQIIFLEGEPAGSFTFLTIHTQCPDFDEPDPGQPVEVERSWTLNFAPPGE